MAWQPRRQYVGKARKAKSKTSRTAKDTRVGRRARRRMVNAPKQPF